MSKSANIKTTKNGPYLVKNLSKLVLGEEETKPGSTIALCRCGKTSNADKTCDGSHNGAGFKDDSSLPEGVEPEIITVNPNGPYEVKQKNGETLHLCRCGLSSNLPMCDGSHRQVWGDDKAGEKQAPAPKASIPDLEDLVPSSASPAAASASEPEPTMQYIKSLARDGLTSHHGPMGAMGIRSNLPSWGDIQILVSQLAVKPLMDDTEVSSVTIIGPRAKKPLFLKLPVFVSDMSFGALSQSAKVCLARGAEMAGTGICSGEGGMLPEEQAENSRYFLEFASGEFGWDLEKVKRVQAFHFKGGQGAKTGTGGHLPGAKVTQKIADVRGLEVGQDAVSPATFRNLTTAEDFRAFADKVREVSGGIPIGFKLSAQHIEQDIQFALDASADYIILDGRGGATGAAPLIFRDNISVPTIPALARARAYLDKVGATDVTLVITGGLRTPDDFIKALCLGADAVAIANSAIQSIGCVAARACNTNTCPAGIATQNPDLEALLDVDKGSKQLCNFLTASRDLIKVMARACSHTSTTQFSQRDIGTWKRDMADLTGIEYTGLGNRYK